MNCRSAITVAAIAAAALCESDICMTTDNIKVLLLYMFDLNDLDFIKFSVDVVEELYKLLE